MRDRIEKMLEALDIKYSARTEVLLEGIREILTNKGKDGRLKTRAGEEWCKNCIHAEMCKWYGTNGCDLIQEAEKGERREEYYMIYDDGGTGYGGFETMEEALKALASDRTCNHIEKVYTTHKEVFRINEYNGIGCDECEVTKSREPRESEDKE